MKITKGNNEKVITGKTLYLPFLLISVIFMGGYSFLNWFFVIRTQSNFISADLSNYWLPFSLPIIPVFIFFKFRAKQININTSQLILISLMTSMLIAPATIMLQHYIDASSGSISYLENVGQLPNVKKTRYYCIKNFEINKKYSGIYGKEKCASRTSYDYDIFIVSPVLINKADTLKNYYTVWVLKRYNKNFALFGKDDIQKREDDFWNVCMNDFDKVNLNEISYFKIAEFNDESADFEKALYKSSKAGKSGNIFLEPLNQDFENRAENKLLWFIALFITGQLLFIFIPPFINKIINN